VAKTVAADEVPVEGVDGMKGGIPTSASSSGIPPVAFRQEYVTSM